MIVVVIIIVKQQNINKRLNDKNYNETDFLLAVRAFPHELDRSVRHRRRQQGASPVWLLSSYGDLPTISPAVNSSENLNEETMISCQRGVQLEKGGACCLIQGFG